MEYWPGGSVPRGTGVGQVLVTGAQVSHSRGLALVVGLIWSLVCLCFISDSITAFPVMGINGLGEYMEVGNVIRFTYSGDLIL